MDKQTKFIKLYEPVHESFERFCNARAYGFMDPEDLINESLLVAFEKMHKIKNTSHFLSFLIGISIKILANQNRKKKPEILEEGFQAIDINAKTELDAEVYLLYQCLNQLPEVQKEALILFEISGFSIKEISKMQAASESAIKQRLKRGREKLTQLLTFENNTIHKKEVSHGN